MLLSSYGLSRTYRYNPGCLTGSASPQLPTHTQSQNYPCFSFPGCLQSNTLSSSSCQDSYTLLLSFAWMTLASIEGTPHHDHFTAWDHYVHKCRSVHTILHLSRILLQCIIVVIKFPFPWFPSDSWLQSQIISPTSVSIMHVLTFWILGNWNRCPFFPTHSFSLLYTMYPF